MNLNSISKAALAAIMIITLSCLPASPGWSAPAAPSPGDVSEQDLGSAPAASKLSVEEVLNGIKKRYGISGFCGDFGQVATLAGMGVQDTASGQVCFQYPDKMRWHYSEPEEQLIVTDGKTVWIYRPVDNQVLLGMAQDYFGAGEGASFFTDVDMLKRRFDVAWAEPAWEEAAAGQQAWALRLTPKEARPEFVSLYLIVDKSTFDVLETASFNNFGDETRIRFSRPDFAAEMDGSQFVFVIPQGVDVMELAPSAPEE